MNLTHQSHLRWWTQPNGEKKPKEYFRARTAHSDTFGCETGVPELSNGLSWYDEFKRAMSLLVEEHGANLNVFYSGGFDSEILVRTLVEMGANPIAHTVCFTGEENTRETQNTTQICLALDVKHVIWKHDILDYVRREKYMELGLKYTCNQLAYLVVLEYVRKCTDLPCLMGGEIYIQKHEIPAFEAVPSKFDWYYIYRENEDAMTYRYSLDTGHPLINETFSYTPELIRKWTEIPTVRSIVDNKRLGKLSLISSKPEIFREAYPHELVAKRKMHGYESLMWTNELVRHKIGSQLMPMGVAKTKVEVL